MKMQQTANHNATQVQALVQYTCNQHAKMSSSSKVVADKLSYNNKSSGVIAASLQPHQHVFILFELAKDLSIVFITEQFSSHVVFL